MAIQVRLDLTPAEFDLTRRALDSYAQERKSFADDRSASNGTPEERRNARTESLHASDLLAKLNK